MRDGNGNHSPRRRFSRIGARRTTSSYSFEKIGFLPLVADDAWRFAMSQKAIEPVRQVLEKCRDELRRNLFQLEQYGRIIEDETAPEMLDPAGSRLSNEVLSRRLATERTLLQNVESALNRIQEGRFGRCVSCGKEISTKRLEAVPWARYCIHCQGKLEGPRRRV